MLDWTVNFGNVLTVIAMAAGCLTLIIMTRGRVDSLSVRMLAVENQLVRLIDILVQQGRHDERMSAMDTRIAAQGKRLDELAARFNHQRNSEKSS